MYQTKIDTSAVAWSPLDFHGVSMKVLWNSESTGGGGGGMTVMTRIAAGGSIPAHSHTRADETVFVIEGDFVEDGVTYGPGSFFAGRAGSVHGPHRSRAAASC